jgi:phospholipid transport system transporter-binding protein
VSEATLTDAGGGRWVLGGVLDFTSVPQVWRSLESLLNQGGELAVSLADVGQTNSAGLVMLIEALDVARDTGCSLSLVDVPAEMLDLARLCGCEALISGTAAAGH